MYYAYFQEHIAKDIYTNVRFYDHRGNLQKLVRPDEMLQDEGLVSMLLKSPLLRDKEDFPLIFTLNRRIIYAITRVPEGSFLLGPTLFLKDTPMRLDLSLDPGLVSDLIPLIAPTDPEVFAGHLLALFNLNRSGEKDSPFLTERELFDRNLITDANEKDAYKALYGTIFDKVENGFVHNPYNHERRERTCIQNGEVEELKEILKERFPGRYGRLSKDPIRQEIYMGIVAVTIACRAAIDGGLHPETAFYLSDVTISRLDGCRDTVTPLKIAQNAEIQYATLVLEQKEKKNNAAEENRHISHCKDYIFAHLHGKLTVQEIADAIGLESNYLSSLFKKLQGTSLKQYIRHQKIKLVKNLLTYSTYSYSEIAAYLGFASQSHMGQEFKKETGVTPRVYREQNASEDFMNEII